MMDAIRNENMRQGCMMAWRGRTFKRRPTTTKAVTPFLPRIYVTVKGLLVQQKNIGPCCVEEMIRDSLFDNLGFRSGTIAAGKGQSLLPNSELAYVEY